MNVRLDRQARRRLRSYVRQLRESLAASPTVDAAEVEADVREHIERELSGTEQPIGLEALESVLTQLGSPTQWARDEQVPTAEARRRREPLGRTMRRSLLAAGLALVVSVPLIALGRGMARVAPYFPASAWQELVAWPGDEAALLFVFVPALIAAAAAVARVSRNSISRGHTLRSAGAVVLGLFVVAALAHIATVLVLQGTVPRLLRLDGYMIHRRSALDVLHGRPWVATALLCAVWLLPWIVYSHACHRATATRPRRDEAQRAYLAGLLLWAPVLGAMIAVVSITAGTLDMRMVVPAMIGLAVTVGVGLSWLAFRRWPEAESETTWARESWLAGVVGRTVLAVGAGLVPLLLFATRDVYRLSHADGYIRRIVINGVVYAPAGLLLGAALAYWLWRRKPWRRGHLSAAYVVPPLALAGLLLIAVAVNRDIHLLHAYTTFRVPLLESVNRPAPVPALGRLLLRGGLLAISTAVLSYAVGRMLPALITRDPVTHRGALAQARAGSASI